MNAHEEAQDLNRARGLRAACGVLKLEASHPRAALYASNGRLCGGLLMPCAPILALDIPAIAF